MKNFKLIKLTLLYIIFFFSKKKNSQYSIKEELDILKENANNTSFNSIKNLRKVVYSVNFGNYDKIHPFNLQKGFDFILFTDNPNISYNDTNWTIFRVPKKVKDLNISRIKKQRFIKLHPHLFFKNYSLSIYIDASFQIKGDLNEFLLRILSKKYKIYTFEHPDRNKILNETFAVVEFQKEKLKMSEFIRNRYKKENFPDNNGLIESCLIVRKHNEKEVINQMEKWYEEIEKYSHRDQLSFNYISWKTGVKFKYISKTYTMLYFNQHLHL